MVCAAHGNQQKLKKAYFFFQIGYHINFVVFFNK